MSREYRSLARALQPQQTHTKRSLLFRLIAFVIRHLPEIIVAWLLIRAWQSVVRQIGPVWTDIAAGALMLALMSWCSRRFISSVAARTGVARSTRIEVMNRLQTDSGMRNIVMPAQRSLMIVVR